MAKSDENAVQGSRTPYSNATPGNVVDFIVQQDKKNDATALPVQVQAVYPGDTTGYVDVLPLIGTYNGKKEYVPPVTLYHLPYSRIQGGVAALIIDPVVGDKGLAVFCSGDVSNVTADSSEPQQPGSYRAFSMSDGYYIGGFLNRKPSVYVEVTQGGVVNVTAPATVNINSPTVNISGNVNIQGNTQMQGTLTVIGTVTGAGVGLSTHVHSDVEPGSGNTGGPHG